MSPFDPAGLRSALFVPLADERFLAKAPERGADALLLDLEDSVPPAQKAEARARVPGAARQLAARGATVMLRVNAGAELLAADLDAAAAAAVACVFLPKVETATQLLEAERMLAGSDVRVVAMLESPAGVLAAADIARAGRRLAGLAFGSEDYSGSLGIPSTIAALDWPAQALAVAARAHGLAALGVPGPVAEIEDMAAFERLLRRAKAMGYTGFMCIHPRQVVVTNRVYTSTPEEVALAMEIVAAYDAAAKEGRGAIALHGRMIDAPVVDQARATLRRART